MFERILAAVDDSTRMRLVMQAGRMLAERAGGSLVVLRVRQAEAERDHVTDSDAALAEQTRALRAGGVAAHYLVHVGDPEREIIQTAQRQHSTLIIIASRQVGPRALPHRRMTARLAAHAPAPVLVIPELDAAGERAEVGAPFGADTAPLLVALDGSPLAERALPYAAEMATLLGRPLALTHVALPLFSQDELAQAWVYIEEARRRMRQRISRDLHVDAHVVTGAPEDELLWAAEGRQAGVLVMCAQGKTGRGSRRTGHITMETLRKAMVPVLLIPSPVLASDVGAQELAEGAPPGAEQGATQSAEQGAEP